MLSRATPWVVCGLLLTLFGSYARAGSLPDEFYKIQISTDLNAELIEVEDSLDAPIAGVILPDSQSVAAAPDSGNAVEPAPTTAESTAESKPATTAESAQKAEESTSTADASEISEEEMAAAEVAVEQETAAAEASVEPGAESITETVEPAETQAASPAPETEPEAESADTQESEVAVAVATSEDGEADPAETQVASLTAETEPEAESADTQESEVAVVSPEDAETDPEAPGAPDGTVQAGLDSNTALPETPLADEEVSREQLLAEVDQVVQDWSRAWANQDVERYLEQYSLTFIPADSSLDWASWKFLRYTRLTRPTTIELALSEIEFTQLDAEQATVVFNQVYRSNLYQDVVIKSLELVNENGQWKISAEEVLEIIR